eukprot:211883_1
MDDEPVDVTVEDIRRKLKNADLRSFYDCARIVALIGNRPVPSYLSRTSPPDKDFLKQINIHALRALFEAKKLSGPSGIKKSSLIRYLMKKNADWDATYKPSQRRKAAKYKNREARKKLLAYARQYRYPNSDKSASIESSVASHDCTVIEEIEDDTD